MAGGRLGPLNYSTAGDRAAAAYTAQSGQLIGQGIAGGVEGLVRGVNLSLERRAAQRERDRQFKMQTEQFERQMSLRELDSRRQTEKAISDVLDSHTKMTLAELQQAQERIAIGSQFPEMGVDLASEQQKAQTLGQRLETLRAQRQEAFQRLQIQREQGSRSTGSAKAKGAPT